MKTTPPMTMTFRAASIAVLIACTWSAILFAGREPQTRAGSPKTPPPSVAKKVAGPDAKTLAERRRASENRRLFRTDEPLVFTLTADFKAVNRDRDPKSTKTFPATI